MAPIDTREASPDEQAEDGSFKRHEARFRDRVTADGSSGYRAEPGRFHLYACYACPWSHRTILYRQLKGLEDVISLTVLDPERDERGWAIAGDDPVNDFKLMSEAYVASEPGFDGHVTAPVLWDRERTRIVNNESSEIIRMFDREFDAFAGHPERRYCPDELRAEIDELNAFVYENVNDGVYKTGFAKTQAAYERAFGRLFDALDELDARLSQSRFLLGGTITEADWRLFATLVRFDSAYVGHFKCNLRRVADYPQLSGYLRELYQHPGVAATVNMDHIKRHYYRTHPSLNPTGIVPLGPALDLAAPHGREQLS